MTTKKHLSEKQAVTLNTDKLPFGLHLKHADIPLPLTFICRCCGAVCQWEEPHSFDCQVAMTAQQRKQVMGDDAEAGKK